MDPEFDELKREFLTEAEGKIKEISSALRSETPPSAKSLERMIYLAHQLKGAGGSYGFQVISTEAAAIESSLEKVAKGDANPIGDIEQRLQNLASVVETRSRELAR